MSGLRVREATELLATARTLTPEQHDALMEAYLRSPSEGSYWRATIRLNRMGQPFMVPPRPPGCTGAAFHVVVWAVLAVSAGNLISAADRAALLAPWESVIGA